MNKYFEVNNINLTLGITGINSKNTEYKEFIDDIYSKMNEGYSIGVSSVLNSEVWMTDGKEWIKPNEKTAGHQMNFEGFDENGNILVCSWGKTYMFPKEFYQRLEFMGVKI